MSKVEMDAEQIIRLAHFALTQDNARGAFGLLDDCVKELDARKKAATPAPSKAEPRCGYCGKDTVHPFSDGWHCTLCGRVTPHEVAHATPPFDPGTLKAIEERLYALANRDDAMLRAAILVADHHGLEPAHKWAFIAMVMRDRAAELFARNIELARMQPAPVYLLPTPPGCPSGEGPACKAGDAGSSPAPGSKDKNEAASAIRTGSGGKPEPAGASPGGGGRELNDAAAAAGKDPHPDAPKRGEPLEQWSGADGGVEAMKLPKLSQGQLTASVGSGQPPLSSPSLAEDTLKSHDTLRRERDEARAAHAAAISERDFFEQHLNVTRTKLAAAQAAIRLAKGMIVAVREYRDEEGNSPFNIIDHYSLDDIEKQLRECLPEGEG